MFPGLPHCNASALGERAQPAPLHAWDRRPELLPAVLAQTRHEITLPPSQTLIDSRFALCSPLQPSASEVPHRNTPSAHSAPEHHGCCCHARRGPVRPGRHGPELGLEHRRERLPHRSVQQVTGEGEGVPISWSNSAGNPPRVLHSPSLLLRIPRWLSLWSVQRQKEICPSPVTQT